MWFMFVIPFIMFFITFLTIVFTTIRAHNHSKSATKSSPTTISRHPESIEIYVPVTPIQQPKEDVKTCEYCGSKIKSGETKCDACGAKVKK